MSKALKSIPIRIEEGPEAHLNRLLHVLTLSHNESYLSFDRFVQNLNAQSFITDKFLEENSSSNFMEMSIILNKYERQSKKIVKPQDESVDSPLYKLQQQNHCASHYDQNIFKELLYDNDLSNLNRSKLDSKKPSDFEGMSQLKNFHSCSYAKKNQQNQEWKNHSCMSEIHISKDRFSKIKLLYQKKTVREFFENELKNENNPLCWIRTQFIKIYLKDFNNKRKILSSFKMKNEAFSQELGALIKDLNIFFKIFSDSIVKYYDLQRVDLPFFITREVILEIVISLTFDETPNLFKFLFMYQKKIESNVETQIDLNKKKLVDSKPEDFGVSERFSLTQRTLNLLQNNKSKKTEHFKESFGKFEESLSLNNEKEIVFLSLMEEYPNSDLLVDDVKEDDEEKKDNAMDIEREEITRVFKNSFTNLIRHTISLSRSCTSPKIYENQKLFTHRPYEKAIRKLDEIGHLKNPTQIIFKIMEAAIEIFASIKWFYETAGDHFKGNIESDEIMMIFIYLCAQSDCAMLYSKCCLIQNFIAAKKACSIYGYYLTTLIASLSCLSDSNFYSRMSKKHSKKHFLSSLRKFSSKCGESSVS